MRAPIEAGARAALPVVLAKRQPLEFPAWQPEARMARGVWNFPIPAEAQVVRPGALLVPLVGFDSRGYRPRLPRRPLRPHARRAAPEAARDRVGYELGRLATIHPQPHGTPWTHW